MINWQDKVTRSTLVCAATGEKIIAGSVLISGLVFTDNAFSRIDFSEAGWELFSKLSGQDKSTTSNEENTEQQQTIKISTDIILISRWTHQLPPAHKKEETIMNAEQLFTLFQDIRETRVREQQCLVWCLSLLLMRLKKFRYLDIEKEFDETSNEILWMLYEERPSRIPFRIRDPHMTTEEQDRIQEELLSIIGY